MRSLNFGIFACMLVLVGCADTAATDPAPRTSKNSTSGSRISLTLSWKAVSTVSTYHVFFVDPQNKTREIDSLMKGDNGFTTGQLIIDSNNLESWPKTGEKACFYVVAASNGVKSDPSARACITL